MDAAIVIARAVQYLGGMALFGTPLFLLQTPSRLSPPWGRPLIAGAAALLLAGALVYLPALTAEMAGDAAAARDPDMLRSVLLETPFGVAVLARGLAACAAIAATLVRQPGRRTQALAAALGAVALTSFAWTGHGAADPGPRGLVHLAADLLHLLAAGVWMGALFAFALRLARPGNISASEAEQLHRDLAHFAGVGSAAVAAIVASGLVNGWFLVGPARFDRLPATPYGLVLVAKLAAFAGMVLLAARNPFVHTPALAGALSEGATDRALGALRRSILLEMALGVGVLALVALLGVLAPISAG